MDNATLALGLWILGGALLFALIQFIIIRYAVLSALRTHTLTSTTGVSIVSAAPVPVRLMVPLSEDDEDLPSLPVPPGGIVTCSTCGDELAIPSRMRVERLEHHSDGSHTLHYADRLFNTQRK